MITMNRRTLLRVGIGTSAVAMLGGYLGYDSARSKESTAWRPASPDRRLLVMIEMAGGSDGLSLLVPYADPRYQSLRPSTAVDPASVHRIDDALGFHGALSKLAQRGASVVAGVGIARPDLSHFEMLRRWWTGDPDGTPQPSTGFLGRLCDVIGDPTAPAVGISLGLGSTQALACERVTTLSVDTGSEGAFPSPSDVGGLARVWMAAQRAMAHPDRGDSALAATTRTSSATALRFSDAVANLPPGAEGYPDSDLGVQLRLAARLLADDNLGLRVIHVPMGDDFDTHYDHLSRYQSIMENFDRSVEAFRIDLEHRGIRDRVLIATFSEFGRRVPDNGSSGLDHGAASTALLMGPTNPGVFGGQPSLAELDPDDNLKASVNMTEYYATIAEGWFGVPANEVLAGSPRPIAGIIPVK
jgi:uncharacterized protein (DUF1501 family)